MSACGQDITQTREREKKAFFHICISFSFFSARLKSFFLVIETGQDSLWQCCGCWSKIYDVCRIAEERCQENSVFARVGFAKWLHYSSFVSKGVFFVEKQKKTKNE